MRRSLPPLPENAREIVEAMIRPETLAVIAGTVVVWAGSHFFGIGEIVDVILLKVGVITLGFAVFEGSIDFYDFATGAIAAVFRRGPGRGLWPASRPWPCSGSWRLPIPASRWLCDCL